MTMRLMEHHLCNLKLYAKELSIQSKKCNKEEAAEKAKCKRAIQNGAMEKARIHSENAIRQKNQGLNYLRLSARVDAVASRIQSAVMNRKVMSSIGGVCVAMDLAMKTMNLESIAACMDKFETQFENLDVQTSFTENAMNQTTTTSVPINDVNNLMQQVADEAGLDLKLDLPRSTHDSVAASDATTSTGLTPGTTDFDDDLTARLARLRMNNP